MEIKPLAFDKWLPDSASKQCQKCEAVFTVSQRRHHCRACGGLFCADCSPMHGTVNGEPVRVCAACVKLTGERKLQQEKERAEKLAKVVERMAQTHGNGGSGGSGDEQKVDAHLVQMQLKGHSQYAIPQEHEVNRVDESTPGVSKAVDELMENWRKMQFAMPQLPEGLWMPDDKSDKCLACSVVFDGSERRHHCRVCGLLYCDACTPLLGLPVTRPTNTVEELAFRVCKPCARQHVTKEVIDRFSKKSKEARAQEILEQKRADYEREKAEKERNKWTNKR